MRSLWCVGHVKAQCAAPAHLTPAPAVAPSFVVVPAPPVLPGTHMHACRLGVLSLNCVVVLAAPCSFARDVASGVVSLAVWRHILFLCVLVNHKPSCRVCREVRRGALSFLCCSRVFELRHPHSMRLRRRSACVLCACVKTCCDIACVWLQDGVAFLQCGGAGCVRTVCVPCATEAVEWGEEPLCTPCERKVTCARPCSSPMHSLLFPARSVVHCCAMLV